MLRRFLFRIDINIFLYVNIPVIVKLCIYVICSGPDKLQFIHQICTMSDVTFLTLLCITCEDGEGKRLGMTDLLHISSNKFILEPIIMWKCGLLFQKDLVF